MSVDEGTRLGDWAHRHGLARRLNISYSAAGATHAYVQTVLPWRWLAFFAARNRCSRWDWRVARRARHGRWHWRWHLE